DPVARPVPIGRVVRPGVLRVLASLLAPRDELVDDDRSDSSDVNPLRPHPLDVAIHPPAVIRMRNPRPVLGQTVPALDRLLVLPGWEPGHRHRNVAGSRALGVARLGSG